MFDPRNRVLAAMFDVKPVTETGDLDLEKLEQVEPVLDLTEIEWQTPQEVTQEVLKEKEVLKEQEPSPEVPLGTIPVFPVSTEPLPTREELLAELERIDQEDSTLRLPAQILPNKIRAGRSGNNIESVSQFFEEKEPIQIEPEQPYFPLPEEKEKVYLIDLDERFTSRPGRLGQLPQPTPGLSKRIAGFLIAGILVALLVPALIWFNQGWQIKGQVLGSSLTAYQNLLSARQSLEKIDFQTAEKDFQLAEENFFQANQEIKKLGQVTVSILENLPGGSLISTGGHLVKVGESLARAGKNLTAGLNLFTNSEFFSLFDLSASLDSEHLTGSAEPTDKSLTELIAIAQGNVNLASQDINLAEQELSQVEIEELPLELQEQVQILKKNLPLIGHLIIQAQDYSQVLLEILGHRQPKQYLLLFQNNSEIRATGGFIGTYGLLTLDQGRLKQLFIEGVFNADGQLIEKIIPPRPIQKISTAWSMHDANWFADFPTSAQKVAWFYEKTGGPTVDGVLAMTPTVIERLLELTGPIEMPEYGVLLTPENFVELIQYKVEIDYDKELNRPKQILADFAPKFIQTLAGLGPEKQKQALQIILDCLQEKHILIYFNDRDLEKLVEKQGWAGQILATNKDYLSVVSSNINGYKTDRVVKETIRHQAEIQQDGSIIDTVTISRQHQGGSLNYDWWNRVNANYLRVYVPKGSQLVSAQGQTLEVYVPPIDYQASGFKPDPLVQEIEAGLVIDQKTGTHIFEESGKTVFGNWVYVSPGQTVQITYQYKLPFQIDLTKPSDSYSLLVQKQAGSLGSRFSHQLKFPADWQVSWQYPTDWRLEVGDGKWESDLRVDRFLGVTFEF